MYTPLFLGWGGNCQHASAAFKADKRYPQKVSFASPEEISPLPVKSAATEHHMMGRCGQM